MARQVENGMVPMLAGATVAAFRLVKLSTAKVVHNTATSTDVPIAVSQDAAADDGSRITVRDLKAGGTHKVTAAGAVTAGADVYAAAAGKVQALPEAAGTYRRVGQALEAASDDGEIIEIWASPDHHLETVSE